MKQYLRSIYNGAFSLIPGLTDMVVTAARMAHVRMMATFRPDESSVIQEQLGIVCWIGC